MSDAPKAMKAADTVMQGYMLKKKRKKMQGMARRYFWLSPAGALSYSFNPTSPIRDSLLVNLAYVSASRKSRTFHIDSGKTVYHCKTLTLEDFDKWTEALKAFSGAVLENEQQGEQVLPPTSFQVAKNDAGGAVDLSAISVAISQMSAPLKDLDTLQAELRQQFEVLLSPSPVNSPGNNKLKFFKKQQGREASSSSIPTRQSSDDYFEAKPMNSDALLKQYEKALGELRRQHEALSAAVRAAPASPKSPGAGASSPVKTYASRSSAAFYGHRASLSRASSFSVNSNDDDDFYDAVPGEFVLEEEGASSSDEEEEPSTPGESTTAEDDEDDEDEERTWAETTPEPEGGDKKPSRQNSKDVQRRARLPAPAGEDFSMLGLLRKNVGKDLSQISFPVNMNEPLSALQRIAEELEYSKLLDDAAKLEDPIERLALVATFAVSACSSNKYRSSRKPFNPLLGETYECIRPDRGFEFIAEKVSHNPVVMAFHSHGKGWKLDGHAAPLQKFWGRSMEVNVSGDYNISFPDKDEVYSIRKPASFVRNLVAGTKYLEIVGDLVVECNSGAKAVVNFKEGSTWGGNSGRNKIEGKVTDENGSTRVELAGRWDEHVDKKEGGSKFERLWEINDFPSNPERYYGFSKFSTELNETTSIEDKLIAPTDSRLRPDQLAMENGDVDKAEELKKKLEEKQRAKRKDNGGGGVKPAFFTQEGDGWKYNGQYFEKREKKEFEDPDIFVEA